MEILGAYTRAIEYARTAGHEDGMSAATLGPDVEPDLSGEWAGTLTGPELVDNALSYAGVMLDAPGGDPSPERGDWFSDVCDAYEQAFTEAVRETWPDNDGEVR